MGDGGAAGGRSLLELTPALPERLCPLAILLSWSSMKNTTPNVVKCDRCGRLSPVEGWEPVYEDPSPIDTAYTPPRVKEINCEIRCNKCGIRIQAMAEPRIYSA